MAELTTVYKCTNGANFPVQWQSPEDGQLNWVRDASHIHSRPLPLISHGEFMKTPGTGISGLAPWLPYTRPCTHDLPPGIRVPSGT